MAIFARTLKRWLDAHRVTEPINLCYFGTADPRYYQIAHFNTPGSYRLEISRNGTKTYESGFDVRMAGKNK